MTEALIFDAVRTPRGKGKRSGALHGVRPVDLLATLRAVADRQTLDTSAVDDVIVGCVRDRRANRGLHRPFRGADGRL